MSRRQVESLTKLTESQLKLLTKYNERIKNHGKQLMDARQETRPAHRRSVGAGRIACGAPSCAPNARDNGNERGGLYETGNKDSDTTDHAYLYGVL